MKLFQLHYTKSATDPDDWENTITKYVVSPSWQYAYDYAIDQLYPGSGLELSSIQLFSGDVYIGGVVKER